MKLEKSYRLYRKMLRWAVDYCDLVVIYKIYPGDIYDHPTDVIVTFKPKIKRELTKKELKKMITYKKYQNIDYKFDDQGNMVWQ